MRDVCKENVGMELPLPRKMRKLFDHNIDARNTANSLIKGRGGEQEERNRRRSRRRPSRAEFAVLKTTMQKQI